MIDDKRSDQIILIDQDFQMKKNEKWWEKKKMSWDSYVYELLLNYTMKK